MNKELILEVADKIEQYPISYDQGEWRDPLRPRECYGQEVAYPECGSSFCLAGHILWLAEGGKFRSLLDSKGASLEFWEGNFGLYPGYDWFTIPATRLAGISIKLGDFIFNAHFKPIPPHDIVSALRQWAETGNPVGCMIHTSMWPHNSIEEELDYDR